MDRKNITFTVVASIVNNEEHIWQKDARKVRKILKDEIGNIPNVKVIKIDSKEDNRCTNL